MSSEPVQSPVSPAPAAPRRRLRTVLAVAGLLAVGGVIGAGVVQAQMGDGPWGGGWRRGDGPGWRGMGRDMGPGMDRGPRAERMMRFCSFDTARYHPVARAFAKADLRMTDVQAKEFDALADQVLPALEDVKREACNNFTAMSGKATEKLAQLSSVLRKAADAADKALEPANRFYASLSPDQQARIDELSEGRRGIRRWRN